MNRLSGGTIKRRSFETNEQLRFLLTSNSGNQYDVSGHDNIQRCVDGVEHGSSDGIQ